MMTNDGMELRTYVLHTALQLESYSKEMLRILLGVDDNPKGILGHTSRALGFDTRMQLLMEMNAWKAEHKSKLLWFMQFRNQMMHNIEARSMVLCMAFTAVQPKELLKAFPQDVKLSLEEQLLGALVALSEYVLKSTNDLMKAALDKIMLQSQIQLGIIEEVAKNHLNGIYDAQRASAHNGGALNIKSAVL